MTYYLVKLGRFCIFWGLFFTFMQLGLFRNSELGPAPPTLPQNFFGLRLVDDAGYLLLFFRINHVYVMQKQEPSFITVSIS